MIIRNNSACCGVRELHHIYEGTAPAKIEQLARHIKTHGGRFAYVFFTDTRSMRKGNALMNRIIKDKLGDVSTQRAVVNPNSRNQLKFYVWQVNHKGLSKWLKARTSKRTKNVKK